MFAFKVHMKGYSSMIESIIDVVELCPILHGATYDLLMYVYGIAVEVWKPKRNHHQGRRPISKTRKIPNPYRLRTQILL